MYQACNYLEENHNQPKTKYVTILTDSQSELQGLNNIDFKSSIALKTAEALKNISWWTQRCTIAWVKAYVGIEGNEAADGAARKGAEIKTNTLPIKRKTNTGGYIKGINRLSH